MASQSSRLATPQIIVTPVAEAFLGQSEQPSQKPALPGSQEYANYQLLVERTVDVFGDETKASIWLSLPNSDLNGESPLQAAQKSGYKADLIEPILMRIEHGIFP